MKRSLYTTTRISERSSKISFRNASKGQKCLFCGASITAFHAQPWTAGFPPQKYILDVPMPKQHPLAMKAAERISSVRNRWLDFPEYSSTLPNPLPKVVKEWEIRDLLVEASSGTKPCTSCCTQCSSNCCYATQVVANAPRMKIPVVTA